MNEYTKEQQYMIAAASDLYENGSSDRAIVIGLTQGDGWWGNVLATVIYESSRTDFASDFHDFCALNNLDRTEIKSAEYFLKQFKLEQKIKDIEGDFV